MKYFWFAILVLAISSCTESEDDRATNLLSKIETLYQSGKYSETLDSITSLREKFPKAINARKRALVIWQESSLKMAQGDVMKTDSALQATLAMIPRETDKYKANMLRVKRDSLKARYEAMCGVVHMIHVRQKQAKP